MKIVIPYWFINGRAKKTQMKMSFLLVHKRKTKPKSTPETVGLNQVSNYLNSNVINFLKLFKSTSSFMLIEGYLHFLYINQFRKNILWI